MRGDCVISSVRPSKSDFRGMQFVLTTVLLIAAFIVACADLRELFIGWYSGESITLWQASFLLARVVLCLGVVLAVYYGI